MTALVTPRRVPAVPIALAAGAIVAAAFAFPAVIALSQGLVPPSEMRLTRAMVGAFGGITLPIVGATVAGWMFGEGTRSRSRADSLVAAGAAPMSQVSRLLGVAMGSAALGASCVAAIIVAGLRAHHHLGSPSSMARDAFGSAWAVLLGAAMWTAVACLLVARSGKPGRAWFVVAIDLALRLLPGVAAWVAPSAHIANLLGAPPPFSFVHVPVLSQGFSVAFLVTFGLLASFGVTRSYRGAP